MTITDNLKNDISNAPTWFKESINIKPSEQSINDKDGKTIASASSLDQEIITKIKKGSTVESALEVGKLIGQRSKSIGVKTVVFDTLRA